MEVLMLDTSDSI